MQRKKHHRRLRLHEKLQIIAQRYGSLDNFDVPVRQYITIAKKLHLPFSTVNWYCHTFEAAGKDIRRFMKNEKREFKKIPEHIQRILLSPQILQVWAPYSLVERVELINRQFELKISNNTLHRFYLEKGLKYRTGKAIYRGEKAQSAQIKKNRLAFAQLLANLIEAKKPIIYCDETTFNTWMFKTKSWAKKKDAVVHVRNKEWMTLTVFGAIGFCMNGPVYSQGRSTNKEEFQQFLRKVKGQVKRIHQDVKPIFLYDAATAHTCGASQKVMRELFVPLQIPTYSCEFNSIEKLWSSAKAYFKKKMLQQEREVTESRFKEFVNESLLQIKPNVIQKLIRSNRAFIYDQLKMKQSAMNRDQ